MRQNPQGMCSWCRRSSESTSEDQSLSSRPTEDAARMKVASAVAVTAWRRLESGDARLPGHSKARRATVQGNDPCGGKGGGRD